jgi:hypothetical protein
MNGTCTMLQLGRMGRFANALFQICGVIGIARKNNMNYVFPKFINYDHKERFGSSEEIEVYKFFEKELPAVNGQVFQYRWIDWGYHDVTLNPGNYDLCGHFQSEKYFKHCIGEVREYMKMKGEYEFMKGVCAVHYRAGDYEEGENVYHPRLTMQYYRRAMSVMPKGTRYLVFSDDQERAKQMFGEEVRYADGDYIDDFKAMKACNYFITANSSFSLLPAILSEAEGKIVVCPKKWFGNVAPITGDDCYPENAIVL